MKKSIFFAIIFLGLQGCKEISFQESQPKDKKKLLVVPQKLQGKYLLTDENGNEEDTLFITSTGYRIGHKPKDKVYLSDTLVLKYFKGYYFVNIREQSAWFLRVLQQNKNGDLLFMTMENEGDGFQNYLQRLSKEIKIDSLTSQADMLYQIDPSPKELVGLIRKGFFKKILLRKI